MFDWKRQDVKLNAPVADYSCVKFPLPPPPKGMVWQHNDATGEWKVVNACDVSTNKQVELGTEKNMSLGDRGEGKELDIMSVNEEVNVEHVVLPTDTFQGLCLKYQVSATRLRQANMFSGTNLKLAPVKLIIPVDSKLLEAGKLRLRDEPSLEMKIHSVLKQFSGLSRTEAKYYLNLTDNDVDAAIKEAHEDSAWEESSLTPVSHENQ